MTMKVKLLIPANDMEYYNISHCLTLVNYTTTDQGDAANKKKSLEWQ